MNLREQIEAQPPSTLGGTIRVRLEPESVAALDRHEAALRGQGVRTATRSALIRLAVRRMLIELEGDR